MAMHSGQSNKIDCFSMVKVSIRVKKQIFFVGLACCERVERHFLECVQGKEMMTLGRFF